MKASGLRLSSTNDIVTSRSRLSKMVIPAVGIMLTAIIVGACGSSSATHAPTAATTQKPEGVRPAIRFWGQTPHGGEAAKGLDCRLEFPLSESHYE
jgi:hypothetical protein